MQHTLPFMQSLSLEQKFKPFAAGSHCFWADAAKLTETHACPWEVSHVESSVQCCGHDIAGWQTFPADP